MIVVEPKDLSPDYKKEGKTYVLKTFNHFKPLWVIGEGKEIVESNMKKEPGVYVNKDFNVKEFIVDVTNHRFWDRKVK